MAQSLLVQQLLQQLLSGGGQQMLSPLAPVGKLALAAALKNQQKKQESQDAARVNGLVDVLVGKQLDPQAFDKLAPGTQEAPRYWGNTVPAYQEQQAAPQRNAQRDALSQAMGGDPSLGEALVKAKMVAEMQPAPAPEYDFATMTDKNGNQVRVRTRKDTGVTETVYQGGKKPPAVSTSTTVNVGENAFEKGVGTKAADAFATEYDSARSAKENLPSFTRASQLLGDGTVIAGTGANALLAAKRLGNTLGFTGGEDVASTEEYLGLTGKFVAQQIKAFGAGTGLSDADREFARQIAGGDIGVTPEGLKRLIKMGEKGAKNTVSFYNQRRARLSEKSPLIGDLYPELTLDEAAASPEQPVDLSSLSDEDLLKRAIGKKK